MAKERIKLRTPPFRLSFPNVFSPNTHGEGAAKYGLSMLYYPDKMNKKQLALLEEMKKAAETAVRDFFKIPKGKKIPANIRLPFRDGDEKADLDGYGDGCIFASASSKMRPGVVDLEGVEVDDPEDLYPGCWCRATLTVYAYDNKSKGAAFGLYNLQKIADDASFSSRTSAEDDFADDEWDDDDLDGMIGAGQSDSEEDDPMA